ncbi:mannosyl-oligosaccharide alpha-1,2-mannosidase [Xylographa trunciseda]|nr:mannosyl-oligosaccharide alpha-1,2-mannosidase [Xylographa trunciseda]
MSFSIPHNAPNFASDQRANENVFWGSARRTHQHGHANHGIGNSLNGLLENKSLPMYKDKPYSYAASRRQSPWYKRPRVWLAFGVMSLLNFYLFWTFFRPGVLSPGKGDHESANTWKWLKKPSDTTADWDLRREAVKDAFKLSWDGYATHAWGMDEYHPITKSGKQMTPTGMGWIIVDALDTLMIMNLTSRLSHAREWISTSLNYNQDHEVNTFETTIRMLGGLLSAHYLSTEFPDMAPLSDDDVGKPGEDLYLEKAADLADRLLGAFDTHSGVPLASVNLKTLKGVASHDDGGASSTAEAASLQLEFKYLAMLMGEKLYWQRAEKVIEVIDSNGMQDGLLPIFIHADQGTFQGYNIRLGSRGDSYYEYLIKQYLQTSKEEPVYQELWDEALAGVRKHLITYSKRTHFTVLGERQDGLLNKLTPKMDHLVCFMPGTIALGATEGRPLAEARKSANWTQKQIDEMELAKELTKTCWGMYKAMSTGLAPEITHFEIMDPPQMYRHGALSSSDTDFSAFHGDSTQWRKDYVIKSQDSHNLQRPETIESLFYMWRITGDIMYREWGWEMFKSFVEYSSVENGGGFTSLSNANKIPPVKKDNMESFWLAETLKYFYLLFSPTDFLPLDTIVINTEAHIFPRFKLQRGLKTGWTRKPRDTNGMIIEEKGDNLPAAASELPTVEEKPTVRKLRVVEVTSHTDEDGEMRMATEDEMKGDAKSFSG